MSYGIRTLAVLGLLFSAAISANAQAPVGTISGTVSDSSGAIVPSAEITITDKATNTLRTLTANSEGLFSAPALPPGEYEVRAARDGFRTTQRDAQVVAGSTTTVDMSLSVGATREVVTVEAATAQINYDTHAVAGIISRESIQDIPLNGRSSLQLASLEPGVTIAPGSTSQFNSMFTVTVLGGAQPRITIDGGDINDEVDGGVSASMNFSQEIVQEFQLSSLNFDIASGVGANGSINIVTRSGANDFHGSAYYYYRDHNMAAYPGLLRSTANPNPFFQRKNPGLFVSGPIKKDKLFFFGGYEHMGQTSVITDQNDLPSLQPLNGIFASPLHYNWITARFDYHLSEKESVVLRDSHDGNKNFGPYTGTGAPSAWVYNTNWSDQTVLAITSTFTPNVVNDFRAVYHYWQNEGPNANPSDCVSPCIGTGLPSIITMVGSATYTYGAGNDPNGPQNHQNRSYQLVDTVNWQKGQHRVRIGGDWEYTKTLYQPWDKCDPACISVYSVEQTLSQGKTFPAGAFVNLPTVVNSTQALENLPIAPTTASIYSGVGLGNGSFPGIYQHGTGSINNRLHPWASDTWKVTQSLTVNYGIGYYIETGLFSSNLPLPQYLAPLSQRGERWRRSRRWKSRSTEQNELFPGARLCVGIGKRQEDCGSWRRGYVLGHRSGLAAVYRRCIGRPGWRWTLHARRQRFHQYLSQHVLSVEFGRAAACRGRATPAQCSQHDHTGQLPPDHEPAAADSFCETSGQHAHQRALHHHRN